MLRPMTLTQADIERYAREGFTHWGQRMNLYLHRRTHPDQVAAINALFELHRPERERRLAERQPK